MYRDGFRELEVGRRLWLIVIVKVAIIVTLALTLFPNYLNEAYDTDADRAAHVLDALTPAATEVAP
ncbi:MAG: DUF4492 domain-containing protein [Proteobacteria bacterium]|nr:MAG: DUF4492 domain-containing protein [Pseudomonadota bacterium]